MRALEAANTKSTKKDLTLSRGDVFVAGVEGEVGSVPIIYPCRIATVFTVVNP
jgi:hypothetical protein